jgi:hypothetical protein
MLTWNEYANVLRVLPHSKSFHALNILTCMQCIVTPLDPSGRFSEALRLFDQFLQESNLDAAQQCIDILESMLADFQVSLLLHGK